MIKYKFFIPLLVFSSLSSWGIDSGPWKKLKEKTLITRYLKVHKEFSQKMCSQGEDHRHQLLVKKYRGDGHYLPLVDNSIDFRAIKSNLYILKEKVNWLEKTRLLFEKEKSVPAFEELVAPINASVTKLLDLKKSFQFSVKDKEKRLALEKSREELKNLNYLFGEMLKEVPFLLNYNFPNDHLKNRFEYDQLKERTNRNETLKANELYLRRKIFEDGAYNPDRTRPDRFFRTTIETLTIEMSKLDNFLSENVRYDLEWVLGRLKRYLGKGHKWNLKRIKEWEERTKKMQNYYRQLIKLSISPSGEKRMKGIVEDKKKWTHALEAFVVQKQVETYRFWESQPLSLRALYVLETILFNEVGDVDGPNALERYDVGDVVLNRVEDSFYSSLDETQQLYKKLRRFFSSQEIQKNKWLNTLFKRGEFSFTYYFIHSAVKIFCPDMSRYGRYLRRQNLRVSLGVIKSEENRYEAMRYFSRASMLGRIDIAKVWKSYNELPERPGKLLKNQTAKRRKYLRGDFDFMYSFVSQEGYFYQVVRMEEQLFVVRWREGVPVFFSHRNPHYFTYFSSKEAKNR